MMILYCNGRTYHWLYPYPGDIYNLGPSEGFWIVPGTVIC
jgi:hypothetical protein